jgi:hypothetical protein
MSQNDILHQLDSAGMMTKNELVRINSNFQPGSIKIKWGNKKFLTMNGVQK